MSLLFTSDLHFFHERIRLYRNFDSFEEMHDKMVKDWNHCVAPNDSVYILGDVSFAKHKRDTTAILERLNGKKHLVKGNHDHKDTYRLDCWESVDSLLELKVEDKLLVMCHFPLLTWNKAKFGAWHLHGHCHGNLIAPESTRLDIGWDVYQRPLLFSEIQEIMSTRTYKVVDHHE